MPEAAVQLPAYVENNPAIQNLVGVKHYAIKNYKKVISRGKEYYKVYLTKNESGTTERIARGFAGAVGSVAGTPLVNLSEDFRDATFRPAISGAAKKTIYIEAETQKVVQPKHRRYRPNDNDSIQRFLQDPKIRAKLIESDGHLFYVETSRKGISSFIFIPNGASGDFSGARSIKFYKAKTGKSISNTDEQMRAIRTFCAAYDDVEKGWDKELPKLIDKMVAQGFTQEQAKEALNMRRLSVVIDAKLGCARIYGYYDPNTTNTASYRTGTRISLSDETKRKINKYHSKSMDEKEPLAGERPFKNAVADQQRRQQAAFSRSNSESETDEELSESELSSDEE